MAFPGGAQIAVIRHGPNVPLPVMQLDFLNNTSLNSRITFSRGTGATRVNASGFIEVVGNTDPRFDYDPVTLAPRGLLIEEARTNLLTYSEQFDNAAWVKSNATVTANATASPDGTTNADILVSSTSNTAKFINQSGLASTTGTFTVYAKAAGETVISLWLVGATVGASFTLTGSGSTALLGATSSSITPAGNGWYRCTVQHNAATTTAHIYLRVGAGYIGDGTSGVYIYGAQLEAGAFATSYIPTVASTVSRSADVATMTGTNFSSWYNQAAGTFVIDADSYTIGSADYPLTASDGTSNNRFGFYRTTATIAGYVTTGAVDQMYLTRSSIATNTPYKAAVTATVNDGNMALNGTAAAGDTSITMPTLDRLSIGSNNSSGFMSGHIRAIAYYNTRLPNTQLQTLTAPSLASPLALDFISPTYTVGY